MLILLKKIVKNDEEKSFELLKFLMIDLNLRDQYLPNMQDFQKHMYQLSRLINENCNEIYFHLENNEISTSLYAASWFLSNYNFYFILWIINKDSFFILALFSSQFQMGFVARVFDFLFFEGKTILFKLSMAILTIHKPLLLTCNTFENIVDQLKITIPEMSLIESELIINKSINYEIDNLLTKYEIEFNILNEEFDTLLDSQQQQQQADKIEKKAETDAQLKVTQLEIDNSKLRNQVNELNDKLKLHNLKMENQEDYLLKLYHENKQLKVRMETLEIERDVILKKVNQQQQENIFFHMK